MRSCSIFTGSVVLRPPRRCEMRCTCVSTTTPSGAFRMHAEHDVRRLAADAGELDELVERPRDLAAVLLDERSAPGRRGSSPSAGTSRASRRAARRRAARPCASASRVG